MRKGITISSPSDPPRPRGGGRRARPLSEEELARRQAIARALTGEQPAVDDSTVDPSAVDPSVADAPADTSVWEQPAEPPEAPLADALEDWTQEPALPLEQDPAPEPEPTADTTSAPATATPVGAVAGSNLSAWVAGPLPSQTSSLDDWLQGPIELHAEREAEDAWSTSGSVSGTWGRKGEAVRSRSPEASPAGGDAADPSAAELQRARPAFRRELHGLRAVALGLVAIYHIWLGRVSGGVDVFLFLSAFFLTGTFVRRLESGRPLGIPRYWLHTFKRLLPPAGVTILLVLAATAAFLPSSMWHTIMQEAVASAAYLQNLLLVLLQVDYHARDAGAASPLQHFWSLSVQGQAFVVWPLLFLLVVRRARAGKSVRRPLIAIIAVIGAASLTWSIYSTQTQQEIAYFDTAARMWEFAAGSLLALSLPLLDRLTGARRPEDGHPPRLRTLRALTGWAGIAALLACGIVLDVSTLFPGWIALWPLAAAGAVVIAGHSGRRWGVDAVLSTRPAAFIGDISYALYLVHWPILVIWLHHSGQQRAGLWDGLVVLSGSVLLAWLVTRAVDAPVRRSRWLEARPWRALTAIALSFALVAGAAGGWWAVLHRTPAQPPVAEGPSLATDEVATIAPPDVRPYGWQLGSQWPDLPARCAGSWEPESSFRHVNCQQLLPGEAEASETIVVVGSSHSRQFIPALLPWAQEHGVQVVNLTMDGCDFRILTGDSGYCTDYDSYVLDYLDAVQPERVLTTVTHTSPDTSEESMPGGTAEAVQELLDRNIAVLAPRDTPRWEQDLYMCAEAAMDASGTPGDADEACGADVEEKLAAQNPAADLAQLVPTDTEHSARVTLLDFSEEICPEGRCSPILGDAYVYMDDNHLTRYFVEQVLAGPVTRALNEQVDAAAS